jgi:hypothetical protein
MRIFRFVFFLSASTTKAILLVVLLVLSGFFLHVLLFRYKRTVSSKFTGR